MAGGLNGGVRFDLVLICFFKFRVPGPMEIWQKLKIGSIICQPGPKVCMTFLNVIVLLILSFANLTILCNVLNSCFRKLAKEDNKKILIKRKYVFRRLLDKGKVIYPKYILNWIENSGLDSRLLYCLRFYLIVLLIILYTPSFLLEIKVIIKKSLVPINLWLI